jgi:hypothetical protein
VGVVGIIAIALTVALVVRSGPSTEARAAHLPPLPDRLAYVAISEGDGFGSRVYFRQGGSRSSTVDKGGSGELVGPYLRLLAGPDGDHMGVRFEWSGDGQHAWVLSDQGLLNVLPGALEVAPQGIRTAGFSPDSRLLAVCSMQSWPPRISVLPVSSPKNDPYRPIAGCFPRWSADGVYVAYRLPAPETAAYERDWLGVLNTRLHVTFRVHASWPAAWATAPGYTFAPLAATSHDGRAVLLMSPRGGRQRTLVSAAALDSLAHGMAAPIVSMAWSVEGDRLALGVDDGDLPGSDGLIVVEPRTGRGEFFPWPHAPLSLSWGPGDRLLAELRKDLADVVTLEVRRDGEGYAVASLTAYREASWSPDGRWILARKLTRWYAVDAENPKHRIRFPAESSRWYRAGWCCPPVAVTRLGE